jgi:hypothetical protein
MAVAAGLAMVVLAHLAGVLRAVHRLAEVRARQAAAAAVPTREAALPPADAPAGWLLAGQARAEDPQPPAGPGVGELLAAHGIGPDEFRQFTDGRPVDDSEMGLLLRLLVRLGDCRPADLDRWARRPLDPASLAADPAACRGRMYALRGRVAGLEPAPLPADADQRFGLKQCYRCTLRLDDPKLEAVIYSARIPRAWQGASATGAHAIGDRAAAAGLLVKLAGPQPADPRPVFVAPRVAWHPATPLGELGVDVGLLDDVQDDAPLAAADHEVFYQVLAAVRQAEPGALLRQAREAAGAGAPRGTVPLKGTVPFSSDENWDSPRQEFPAAVIPLFNEPAAQRGRLVGLAGTACRVTRVAVDEPQVAARFHLDHYYEIDLLTPDSQDNPLVVCAADLPEGMPLGGPPGYREPVRVAGFFFKLWRYPLPSADRPKGTVPFSSDENRDSPRELSAADRKIALQSAPLVIGQPPIWRRAKHASAPPTAQIAGGLLALVLAGVWLLTWHWRQTDREFYSNLIAKRRES